MAGRTPRVRNKGGRWYSEAGGQGRYFGKCSEVTHAQATALLWRELAGTESQEPPRKTPTAVNNGHDVTVNGLRDRYLAWVAKYRSPALHREAKRHLGRWCVAVGSKTATAVTGADLEAFQDDLVGRKHALMYVKKHVTSVRGCFNKAVKLGWLPPAFNPFNLVEAIRLDPRPLLESDLPTDAEFKALLAHCKPDMAMIVTMYHVTGMRTHELIEARCGDFQPGSRTIVLGKHKRSRTLREPVPRTITLNPEAFAILERRCRGKSPEDLIFPNTAGKPYTSVLLDDRFATARKRAGVRAGITPYSFRHLWISEMLMSGVDILLVAKMAGTSVKMVETVYGHFRVQSYQEAQAKLDAAREGRR